MKKGLSMKIVGEEEFKERKDKTFTLERNILGVPTFVLNTRAATKINRLEHSWKTSQGEVRYVFFRDSETPFPQVEHARYFDALVGKFATRWNPEGHFWFSIAEIARFAGKEKNISNARKAILETIRRYMYSCATFENSWNGKFQRWSNPFITSTDIWDEQTGELKRNPRSSRKKPNLHRITFNEHVVQSLKDSHTRVFLTESLRSLKPDSYAIFRYFYGFSDRSVVHRDIEDLLNIFPWTGRKSRFLPWLEARLEECVAKGFVDYFEFKDGRLFVKCKSFREKSESAAVIELKSSETKNPRTKKTKPRKALVSKLTNEAVLEEYYRRKQDGLLEDYVVTIVDMLLCRGETEVAIKNLKNHL